MMANADSMVLVYVTEHMRVKAYTSLYVVPNGNRRGRKPSRQSAMRSRACYEFSNDRTSPLGGASEGPLGAETRRATVFRSVAGSARHRRNRDSHGRRRCCRSVRAGAATPGAPDATAPLRCWP